MVSLGERAKCHSEMAREMLENEKHTLKPRDTLALTVRYTAFTKVLVEAIA